LKLSIGLRLFASVLLAILAVTASAVFLLRQAASLETAFSIKLLILPRIPTTRKRGSARPS
jgi:hypothetical protein